MIRFICLASVIVSGCSNIRAELGESFADRAATAPLSQPVAWDMLLIPESDAQVAQRSGPHSQPPVRNHPAVTDFEFDRTEDLLLRCPYEHPLFDDRRGIVPRYYDCINPLHSVHQTITRPGMINYNSAHFYTRSYIAASNLVCEYFVSNVALETQGADTLIALLRQISTAGLAVLQNGAEETAGRFVIGTTILQGSDDLVSTLNAAYTNERMQNISLQRREQYQAIAQLFAEHARVIEEAERASKPQQQSPANRTPVVAEGTPIQGAASANQPKPESDRPERSPGPQQSANTAESRPALPAFWLEDQQIPTTGLYAMLVRYNATCRLPGVSSR
tara:strand:- start:498 stop:1499 length:1002 start_codon:yes stop_codon:yes gene_type:complete